MADRPRAQLPWVLVAASVLLLVIVLYLFFTMSRDGLLPEVLSKVHPTFHTPHVITLITGILVALFAAMFPVARLADVSNTGTLFAFFVVALGVMVLRVRDPHRPRPFRTPFIWVVGPLAMVGCAVLFFSLDIVSKSLFCYWAIFGLVFYFLYGYRRSALAVEARANA